MNWISTKDKQPRNQKEVIIWIPDEDRPEFAFLNRPRKRWTVLAYTDYDLHEITHWMPAPQRPKRLQKKVTK